MKSVTLFCIFNESCACGGVWWPSQSVSNERAFPLIAESEMTELFTHLEPLLVVYAQTKQHNICSNFTRQCGGAWKRSSRACWLKTRLRLACDVAVSTPAIVHSRLENDEYIHARCATMKPESCAQIPWPSLCQQYCVCTVQTLKTRVVPECLAVRVLLFKCYLKYERCRIQFWKFWTSVKLQRHVRLRRIQ